MKRLLLTLGAAAALTGAFLPKAGAAESHSIALSPVNATWFQVELAPGEQYAGKAILKNLLNQPMSGYLYSADGFSTPQGGFALNERKARGTNVATWAGMEPKRLTLKPYEVRMVTFTLAVPKLAEPGDYTGGIVFERDRQQQASTAKAEFGLIERVGARIYLNVAGVLRPSLKVTSLKRNGARFEVTVLNDGNARLTPEPSLMVTSMLGRRTRLALEPKPEALYPQQTVTYKGRWAKPGLLGLFRAEAKVSWDRPGAGAGSASRAKSFWLIPWVLIIVTLAAIALLVSGVKRGVRWLRRARYALKEQKADSRVAVAPYTFEAPAVGASVVEAVPVAEADEPAAVAPRAHKPGPAKRTGRSAASTPRTASRASSRRSPTKGRASKPKAGTISKTRRKQPARSGRR